MGELGGEERGRGGWVTAAGLGDGENGGELRMAFGWYGWVRLWDGGARQVCKCYHIS